MTTQSATGLDEALEAFASEASADNATLARYIRLYPQFAMALADFANELRLVDSVYGPVAPADEAWQDESWRHFVDAVPTPAADPFAGLGAKQLAEVRGALGIPSAVLNGFRDRLVLASSVPRRFAARLASAIGATPDLLDNFLALPSRLNPVASHKSDTAPSAAGEKISFEELLEQAMVAPDRRRDLLDGRD